MTIEVLLERIASGVEALVTLAKKEAAAPKLAAVAERDIAKSDKAHAKKGTTPTLPREAPTEVKAEAPKADVQVATSDEDLFGDEPAAPAKVVTIEEVRAALKDLRTRKSKDEAFAVLSKAGNGAKFLPGSTQAANGGEGILKPEFYAAVLAAAQAA